MAEALARKGAIVTGIDMAEASIKVANMHLSESQLEIDYQLTTVEDFAQELLKKEELEYDEIVKIFDKHGLKSAARSLIEEENPAPQTSTVSE